MELFPYAGAKVYKKEIRTPYAGTCIGTIFYRFSSNSVVATAELLSDSFNKFTKVIIGRNKNESFFCQTLAIYR